MGKRSVSEIHQNKRLNDEVKTLPSQELEVTNTYLGDQRSSIPVFFNEKGYFAYRIFVYKNRYKFSILIKF